MSSAIQTAAKNYLAGPTPETEAEFTKVLVEAPTAMLARLIAAGIVADQDLASPDVKPAILSWVDGIGTKGARYKLARLGHYDIRTHVFPDKDGKEFRMGETGVVGGKVELVHTDMSTPETVVHRDALDKIVEDARMNLHLALSARAAETGAP